MMEQNNPASRVYSILVQLNQASSVEATSAVLAKAFGVSRDAFALMHALLGFQQQIDDIIRYTRKTALTIRPLERNLPQIKLVVAITNFDATWGNYKNRITSEMLGVLENIADYKGVSQEDVIPTETLQELNSELNELFKLVEELGDVDKEFRVFVLRQIELIRMAVSEYRISGAQGFSSYLEGLIFETAKKKIVLKKAKESQSSSSIFEKLKGVVGKVGVFAKSATEDINAIEEVASAGNNLLGLF